jgi:hypothetical protein
LKIIVYSLKDYSLAIEYCLKNSKEFSKLRKHLFHLLFLIYMSPTNDDKENLLKPTLELLNSDLLQHFDIPKLLEIIPENWSLKITNNFLKNILQENLSKKNYYMLKKNIFSTYKFSLQKRIFNFQKELFYIDDDK